MPSASQYIKDDIKYEGRGSCQLEVEYEAVNYLCYSNCGIQIPASSHNSAPEDNFSIFVQCAESFLFKAYSPNACRPSVSRPLLPPPPPPHTTQHNTKSKI